MVRAQRRRQGSKAQMVAWIELSGRGSGPLLLPVNKGDAIQDRRLSPEAIGLVSSASPVTPACHRPLPTTSAAR